MLLLFFFFLRANCLARIFTEMADSFLYNIINYPDTPTGDIKTLDLLLQICKHYDYEVSNWELEYVTEEKSLKVLLESISRAFKSSLKFIYYCSCLSDT